MAQLAKISIEKIHRKLQKLQDIQIFRVTDRKRTAETSYFYQIYDILIL